MKSGMRLSVIKPGRNDAMWSGKIDKDGASKSSAIAEEAEESRSRVSLSSASRQEEKNTI